MQHVDNQYNPYNFVPGAEIPTDSFGKWISADFRENPLFSPCISIHNLEKEACTSEARLMRAKGGDLL